jgi:hypothetical protein
VRLRSPHSQRTRYTSSRANWDTTTFSPLLLASPQPLLSPKTAFSRTSSSPFMPWTRSSSPDLLLPHKSSCTTHLETRDTSTAACVNSHRQPLSNPTPSALHSSSPESSVFTVPLAHSSLGVCSCTCTFTSFLPVPRLRSQQSWPVCHHRRSWPWTRPAWRQLWRYP